MSVFASRADRRRVPGRGAPRGHAGSSGTGAVAPVTEPPPTRSPARASTPAPCLAVVLVVLGAELITSGQPSGGRIRDALGRQVPAWLRRLGATMIPPAVIGPARDTLAALGQAQATGADIILTVGGTMRGPVDELRGVVCELSASSGCGGDSVSRVLTGSGGGRASVTAKGQAGCAWRCAGAVAGPGGPGGGCAGPRTGGHSRFGFCHVA